jgi:hypothetical protein
MKLEGNDMQGKAVLFGGLMIVAATASAQGIFSFDAIPIERPPTIEVNMGPEMVALLGGAARGAAGEAASALEGVTNVRVLVYEDLDEDLRPVQSFIDATATRLDSDGWHAVVRVREDDEQVRVYMKPGAGGLLAGITIMVIDLGGDGGAGEAIFINVAGAIQPERLGQIASTIGIGGMLHGMHGFPTAAP